ncbi:MAG TPA: sigma-70 family RNA polymerase sigma factor [Polyangiaceae bacterium]|nr:sigma-70 family RNA polymerase sigma factor [Polyangiaceae bacterium]
MPQLEPSSVTALRPRLVRLAYRMLGSVAEAEDIVQEALIRYQRVDAEVDRPDAFLARTVSRLALDALKSARRRRETYVGPWLPEPIFDAQETVSDDITLSLMLALERLSPLERATFLLHDVFGMGLDEVASALEREPAACRKLATRAREHVRDARPRYQVSSEHGAAIAHAFYVASRAGDLSTLRQLLAEDVVVYSDGGGKRSAATKPVSGASRVERLFFGIARRENFRTASYYEPAIIDGLPGFITRADDGQPQTTALAIVDGRITAIYQVRNPDKLRRICLPDR